MNVRTALDAAEAILRLGCAPYVPHLSHFWHLVHPHAYEDWLALDLAWLVTCDAVWRLHGVSAGADREATEAQRLGLPIFTGLMQVRDWLRTGYREAFP